MAMDQAINSISVDEATGIISCQGSWTVYSIDQLQTSISKLPEFVQHQIVIDCQQLTKLDSAGAWQIIEICEHYATHHKQTELTNINPNQRDLIALAQQHASEVLNPIEPAEKQSVLTKVGKAFIDKLSEVLDFLSFIGETLVVLIAGLKRPKKLQWRALFNEIDRNGYRALPIIALLSFLIGIVLTYQMGLQLKTYGANIYIVNLAGVSILREFGPLITAIIVAGRTSSSFTAEIGLMKVNEEIDALRTMGLSPIDRLVLPKLIGLVIALPLLTVWADFFGIFGSMVMSKGMLGINYYDFLQRFPDVIHLSDYGTGLSKAPIFALIIATVGCYQGFKVSMSSESVGKLTTKAVVQAIFLIIIADAGFSILFSWLGL